MTCVMCYSLIDKINKLEPLPLIITKCTRNFRAKCIQFCILHVYVTIKEMK